LKRTGTRIHPAREMAHRKRLTNSPRSPASIRILARQRVALDLKTDGYTFDEIATSMKQAHTEKRKGWPAVTAGYCRQAAWRDVCVALKVETEQLHLQADHYRTVLTRRNEKGYRLAWKLAKDEQAHHGERCGALGQSLAFSRRIAETYGLDAPTRTMAVSLTPEQLAAMSDGELDALAAKLSR
jgi:hypothetical protein